MAVHKNAINIMTTIARPEAGQEVTKYIHFFIFFLSPVSVWVFWLSVAGASWELATFLAHSSGCEERKVSVS